MTKKEIIEQLQANHVSFTSMILLLSEADFLFSIDNKWTPGEQAEHILRSIKPVNLAFSLPHFFLKTLFGKSTRPSKTFDALVQKYKEKLAAGGRASGRFIPKPVEFKNKEKISTSILAVNEGICKKVNKCSEKELDTYLLPHPLLGKLTLREMLYFNIHHVEHHKKSVEDLLKRNL
jgi:hypothetical protein